MELESQEVAVTKVPIHNRLKQKNSGKSSRNKNLNISELDNSCQTNEDDTDPKIKLKPKANITLLERAIGYFNTDTDEDTQKNKLNKSLVGGPPFICTICSNWFYVGSKLKLHYVVNHKISHCAVCGNLFESNADKITHLSRFHKDAFCEICQNYYPDNTTLLKHYDDEHKSTNCKYCGIVQPQNMSHNHITQKHRIHQKYLDGNYQEIVVNINNNISDFFCMLCNKSRDMDIFFGHMTAYHNMSLLSLMNLISKVSANISVSGTRKDDINKDKREKKVVKNSCAVCSTRYTHKVPREFHFIYCESKVQCKFCEKQFANSFFMDKHLAKVHSRFSCSLDCENAVYPSLEELENHYLIIHKVKSCRYCLEFVPIENIDEHLEKAHKYKAVIMKNFTDTLYEVSEKENKHVVICCLCDENISLLTDTVRDIFMHYNTIHSVTLIKLLQLASPKPVLEEYEDFYREINESIKRENDELVGNDSNKVKENKNSREPEIIIKTEPASDSEENITDEENGNKLEKYEDYSHLISKIITDFDADEAEIIVNSDSELEDENLDFCCEFCDDKFQKLIDLLTHMTDTHRLKSKYQKYDCEYCSEKLISYKTHANHILSHHNNANFDISKELFNCDCENYQVVKTLARSHVLKVHKDNLDKFNLEEIGLKCRFCDKRFWERTEINEHEVQEHFRKYQIEFQKCPHCLMLFNSQKCLADHSKNTHLDVPPFANLIYKCGNCILVFPTLKLLRMHFEAEHPSSKMYRCPVSECSKLFKRECYMIKHIKSPHQIKEELPTSCSVCGKKFATFRAATIHKLMKHDKVRMGFQCRICKERFSTSEQRKLHYTTVHPGQLAYSCVQCGKGFISKSGLYGHKKIHQLGANLVCPYCNKEFTRRDSYNEHLLIHIGPKHQCPHCAKSFTQRSNLTRHVRIHTGAKPYQCMYCDKRFSDRGACSSHERVHTKEEHCECSYCGKKFTKKQKLKYHIKFHTGEGLLDCEVCGKQFSNSYSLNEHRRIHNQQTLVMCECGRGFSSEKYLQRHIANMHTEPVAKFMCPVCFKPLYSKSSYKEHILTHSSVKHVKCLLCNKEYNTKKTVKRHIQEKHNLSITEAGKYVYQMTPQEAGLNLPSASEMSVNVNDLLREPHFLTEESNLHNIVNNLTMENTSENLQKENSTDDGVDIKQEIVSEDENDDDDVEDEEENDDYINDKVETETIKNRPKRKIKKPIKFRKKLHKNDN